MATSRAAKAAEHAVKDARIETAAEIKADIARDDAKADSKFERDQAVKAANAAAYSAYKTAEKDKMASPDVIGHSTAAAAKAVVNTGLNQAESSAIAVGSLVYAQQEAAKAAAEAETAKKAADAASAAAAANTPEGKAAAVIAASKAVGKTVKNSGKTPEQQEAAAVGAAVTTAEREGLTGKVGQDAVAIAAGKAAGVSGVTPEAAAEVVVVESKRPDETPEEQRQKAIETAAIAAVQAGKDAGLTPAQQNDAGVEAAKHTGATQKEAEKATQKAMKVVSEGAAGAAKSAQSAQSPTLLPTLPPLPAAPHIVTPTVPPLAPPPSPEETAASIEMHVAQQTGATNAEIAKRGLKAADRVAKLFGKRGQKRINIAIEAATQAGKGVGVDRSEVEDAAKLLWPFVHTQSTTSPEPAPAIHHVVPDAGPAMDDISSPAMDVSPAKTSSSLWIGIVVICSLLILAGFGLYYYVGRSEGRKLTRNLSLESEDLEGTELSQSYDSDNSDVELGPSGYAPVTS
eukprot:TRINITY_DN113022_c0_g1_i1.p1 TRINITY_DN113022_c0_g1~~TRINITY_DN113022_c0_g1_i1.p1  ORF type:complete len:557 (+),score=190.50 TRINITY_DN113022_c0_g1_i1:129-1673(+)